MDSVIVMACPVGKGVAEWNGHRLQAVLGIEHLDPRWQCKDCDMKVDWTRELQEKWAAWVRSVIMRADEVLGS